MPVPMKPNDPAYCMLEDNFVSIPVIFREGCFICEDKEFALMGLPLCSRCTACEGHVPADDTICDDCGADAEELYFLAKERGESEEPEFTEDDLARSSRVTDELDRFFCKCADCGRTYFLTPIWDDATVCSEKCWNSYAAYLNGI